MATSSTYVAVRDDKSFRSLSVNERDFLREGAHADTILRLDGRRGDEIRKVRLKLGRWDNGAECTVQWGVGTRVTALCTAELIPPSLERPNEGMVNFTVDLSPMAGTIFRQAPAVGTAPMGGTTMKGPNFSDKSQRLLSNRILRSVERIVLLGGALDSEALVLIPGSWVWRITIALTVLDDGGNVSDACVLAAMATLRHYRKPQVDVDSDALPTLISSTVKEPSPLPLHHTPLSISFALIPSKDSISSESSVATLVDPEKREELVQFGTVSIAMNTHLEVCLLDYGGGYELSPGQLKECLTTASAVVKSLCQQLETALEQADETAQKEILQLLQLKQKRDIPMANTSTTLPADPADTRYLPYLKTSDMDEAAVSVESSKIETSAMEDAETKAEEIYRQQALDYSKGHVASAVREDEVMEQRGRRNKEHGSSLFTSLLNAASGTDMCDAQGEESSNRQGEKSDRSGMIGASHAATQKSSPLRKKSGDGSGPRPKGV